MPHNLNAESHETFSREEKLEEVPLEAQHNLLYQHDGSPAHYAIILLLSQTVEWQRCIYCVACTESRPVPNEFLCLESYEKPRLITENTVTSIVVDRS